jgi:CO/xanthine dehydrogenase Mo-binding subunit
MSSASAAWATTSPNAGGRRPSWNAPAAARTGGYLSAWAIGHTKRFRAAIKGRVAQSNFSDFRVMRINEMPVVEVFILPSTDKPGGIGETGTACATPALTNAVFAATGQRVRKLPIAGQLKRSQA